jgi:hypothetical protein
VTRRQIAYRKSDTRGYLPRCVECWVVSDGKKNWREGREGYKHDEMARRCNTHGEFEIHSFHEEIRTTSLAKSDVNCGMILKGAFVKLGINVGKWFDWHC